MAPPGMFVDCGPPKPPEVMGIQYDCPMCGNGTMRTEVWPTYDRNYRGQIVRITDAMVDKCDSCGEWAVAAAEGKRWEAICKAAIAPEAGGNDDG